MYKLTREDSRSNQSSRMSAHDKNSGLHNTSALTHYEGSTWMRKNLTRNRKCRTEHHHNHDESCVVEICVLDDDILNNANTSNGRKKHGKINKMYKKEVNDRKICKTHT